MFQHVRSILLATLTLLSVHASATHNRAGEIIYCNTGPLTYDVQIITHTKTSSPADRSSLEIFWGDGTSDTLFRVSEVLLPNDAKENIYTGSHTYIGPGIFTLSFVDPNRNAGVLNIPNSVQEPFCVQTQLVIAPTTGPNCSVRFLNPPLQDACLGQPWYHNPAAYDPDGDSLSYELVVCRGQQCAPISNYAFPDEVATSFNTFEIDELTGTISWLNPQMPTGEYNIAFKVTEWRDGQEVGWVTRDMQVTVVPCSNQTPSISSLADTCVEINSLLQLSLTASDPDVNDNLSMNALGEPFVLPNSATFISPSPNNPITGNFLWTPSCDEVRLQPYQVVFEVTDNAQPPNVPLVNVEQLNILVVASAPQNPAASPSITSMSLEWEQSVCTNASGYKIYRRIDPFGFTPSDCETGVPGYTGYSLVGTTTSVADTTFIDPGPLAYGSEYCYMVVACFPDGAQSYASVEFCATLNREAPVITNVTVDDTDPSAGVITVRWENALELDTVQFPGPYFFELHRSISGTGSFTLVNTSATFPFLFHPDTSFVDMNIDTESNGYEYRVDLLNGGGLITSSSPAASMYLTVSPDDEQNLLNWTIDVPWVNTSYDIYREDAPNVWVFIGSSTTNSYLDTGLVNGVEYCYYVESTGSYSDPLITSPLINESQEACGVPIDLTPPCPPDLTLLNECEVPLNTLTWNDPNNSCSADNAGYNIYFTPFQDSTLQFIASINGPSDTVFTHTNGSSVAGCYVVTAIDSSGNESDFSNVVCGENCPVYELPNVFTPNGDEMNDTFRPLNPWRGVEKVNMRVFNRWGQLVFETDDPAIGWSGEHQFEDGMVPDGVYFYLCDVFFLSLAGEELIELKGQVHLLGGGNAPSTN